MNEVKVLKMNEILEHLEEIVATNDAINLLMLEQFKAFFLNFDMAIVNGSEDNRYKDYADYFFNNFPYEPNERHLNVIASFVGWLGRNCGRAFIMEANKLGEQLKSKHKGYIYAWADVNERLIGVNNNNTVLEYLLTPQQYHHHDLGIRCPKNHFVSSHDIETVNFMVHWLATEHGQSFMNVALKRVSELTERNKEIMRDKIYG
jgi:hypothetical protein